MDPLVLPQNPTLPDFQTYIARMVKERGFCRGTVAETFMLLMEECGELAKAARKATGMKTDAQSEAFRLEGEFADVFIYLLDLCNQLGVDLEKAFRDKEGLNKKRVWK